MDEPTLKRLGPNENPSDREGSRQATLDAVEQWAAVLASNLRPLPQPPTLGTSVNESTPIAGGVTLPGDPGAPNGEPLASAGSAARVTTGSSSDTPDVLRLQLDGGDLGPLSLVVDRDQGALRVVIGVGNQQAAGALSSEAHRLEEALRSAGLNVAKVRLVAMDQVGTVLADGRSKREPMAGRPGHDATAEERRRRGKRLNVIG